MNSTSYVDQRKVLRCEKLLVASSDEETKTFDQFLHKVLTVFLFRFCSPFYPEGRHKGWSTAQLFPAKKTFLIVQEIFMQESPLKAFAQACQKLPSFLGVPKLIIRNERSRFPSRVLKDAAVTQMKSYEDPVFSRKT